MYKKTFEYQIALGEFHLKKFLKTKNIYNKIVNNQITDHHKMCRVFHSISKDWASIYEALRPIYLELDKDFQAIDVVDLIYYERWLK